MSFVRVYSYDNNEEKVFIMEETEEPTEVVGFAMNRFKRPMFVYGKHIYLGRVYYIVSQLDTYENTETFEDTHFSPYNATWFKPTEEFIKYILNKYRFVYGYNEVKEYILKYFPYMVDLVQEGRCVHCGSTVSNCCFQTIGENHEIVCDDCYNELYENCSHCGRSIPRGELVDGLCKKCENREYILPYHRNQPELKFYGNDKNNTVPFLGIELEIDDGGYNDYIVPEIFNIINGKNKHFLYCMHDGSLNEGFEMITQPATYDYHYSIKDKYEELFKFLIKKGYLSHDTRTCGLHVHFNRNFYRKNEELYISRLLYLIDKFWDDIVKFSRRNQRSIDRYSKKPYKSIKSYYDNSNESNDHDYHYYAINLANENTIEFRMFRGTLNIETFIATLQFVNNCIIIAREKTAKEIQSMKFEDILISRIAKRYWNRRNGLLNTEE